MDVQKTITVLFDEHFKYNISVNINKICNNDIVLKNIDLGNYYKIVNLRTQLGKFYEDLFSYLCNFTRPSKNFDLVCEKRKIYIELKSNWNTDTCNARHEKFRMLTEFKINNPDCQVIYICLNDNRPNNLDGVDYIFKKNLFRIITGDKAWKYLCDIAGIQKEKLILTISTLVENYLK